MNKYLWTGLIFILVLILTVLLFINLRHEDYPDEYYPTLTEHVKKIVYKPGTEEVAIEIFSPLWHEVSGRCIFVKFKEDDGAVWQFSAKYPFEPGDWAVERITADQNSISLPLYEIDLKTGKIRE